MRGHNGRWQLRGKLLQADRRHPWFVSHTGACSVLPTDDPDTFDFWITVRDGQNRSVIGEGVLSMASEKPEITVFSQPAVERGELGMFDENGVSYPWAVRDEGRTLLYYTGWMPTVLTPFQNHLGLMENAGSGWRRVSRAPIMPRSDIDPLSIGSVAVLREGGRWWMWYTAFLGWGKTPDEPKHRYVLRYATSENGVDWDRDGTICVDSAYGWDHSIGRPSVWHDGTRFHMWFSYRGDHYKLGYASSEDGVNWTRDDELAGIVGEGQWDALDQCYPCVFRHRERLVMLYCGNHYGDGGIGWAERAL